MERNSHTGAISPLTPEAYGSEVEFGTSGLPSSVEQDIPTRFRYWESPDPNVRRSARDALIRKGVGRQWALVDGVARLLHSDSSGRVLLRKHAFPSEYEPGCLASAEESERESAVDADAVAMAAVGASRLVDSSVLRMVARATNRSEASTAEDLLVSATEPVLVEVTQCVSSLSSDMRAIAWRPQFASKCYMSAPVPDDVVFVADAPLMQTGLYAHAQPECASVDEALVAWVSNSLMTGKQRDRAVALVPRLMSLERARAHPREAVMLALGTTIENARLAERVEKSVNGADGWECVAKDDAYMEATFIVLRANVADLHGDVMSVSDNRATAEGFLRYCRRFGVNHAGPDLPDDVVWLTGHWVFDEPMTMHGREVGVGDWLIKLRTSCRELWADICSGRFGGVSPQGRARRVPLETETR